MKLKSLFLIILFSFLIDKMYCQSSFSIDRIVDLCDSLKASLSSDQLAKLEITYSYDNARNWSNLPVTFIPRLGIELKDLSANQKAIALLLIKEISGDDVLEGYNEVLGLFEADQYLANNGGGTTYGRDRYFVCFNGTPSKEGLFSIKIGGHHLQLESTYNKGVMIGATPHFIALEPLTFSINSKDYAPMQEERSAFTKVLSSLTNSELIASRITGNFNDILYGAKNMGSCKDWLYTTTFQGVRVGDLSTDAKANVLNVIKTYVLDKDKFNSQAIINKYKNELDDTYVAYSGSIKLDTKNDYVRISGPSVWIEISVQNGIVLSGVHYHSIWRDRYRDYGGQGSTYGVYDTQIGLVTSGTLPEIINSADQVTIAPNPVEDLAMFKINLPQRSNIEINAYSGKGNKIFQIYNQVHSIGEYEIPLNLELCPQGLIILEIKTNYGVRSVKLIKVKR